jgi:preprotein translocase subunit SecG
LTAVILGFQITTSVLLILFILLHAGRGGGLSEMFGGGMSSVGGSTIMEKNLDRLTIITAVVWTISTVWLHFRIRP